VTHPITKSVIDRENSRKFDGLRIFESNMKDIIIKQFPTAVIINAVTYKTENTTSSAVTCSII